MIEILFQASTMETILKFLMAFTKHKRSSFVQGNKGLYTGKGINNYNLKIIAMVAMLIDHLSYIVVPSNTPQQWMVHLIGRIAAPIFCYLIAEGHYYTRDKKKYLFRLLIFAAISHLPYVLFFNIPIWQATSVIWSLSMGLVALIGATNKHYSIPVKIGVVAVCCLLAYNANWNYLGVLWIVFFGLFRGNFRLQMLVFSMIAIVFYIIPGIAGGGLYITYRFGILLTVFILYLYNGNLGKKTMLSKWGFYLFYPTHLIVLYFLRIFVTNGFA